MDTDVEIKDSWNRGNTARLYTEPKIKLLLDKCLGADWLDKHDDPAIWQLLDKVSDTELRQTHHWLKVKLIDAIRERTRQRWTNGDASASIMLTGGAFLEPSVLTLGFARRFATYRRALLIFRFWNFLKSTSRTAGALSRPSLPAKPTPRRRSR